MRRRWRGRLTGLAILALGVAACAGTARAEPTLVVTGSDGEVLARAALPDGEFTLRYRNSLYGSSAEERYEVRAGGVIALVGLAAEELAVLEEYYAIDDAAEAADGGWIARPGREVLLHELTLAATDLGRRTVVVAGSARIALWELTSDAEPMVRLEVVDR